MTNFNILNQDISFTIQSIVQLGKSGDGYNQFRAPSHCAYVDGNIAAIGNALAIAAIVDRAIKVYKYVLTTEGTVAGAMTYVTVSFGNLPVQRLVVHKAIPNYAAAVAVGVWEIDFSPVGVSINNNVGLYVLNEGGAQIGFSFFVMYSTESWGFAAMTDGSDAL